jgi:hypothetical protein
MDFVTHTCKKCGCAFVAEDYTNCQDIPPHWRLCPECARKAGIDYDKQRPWNSYSEAKKNRIEKQIERLKEFQFKGKTKH